MIQLMNHPILLFVISFFVLWVAAELGAHLSYCIENIREDFAVVVTATLTLLALIVGFTFSMAVGRYDQRKLYEEEEANAIGTEYLRLQWLPTSDATNAQKLLRDYLSQRIAFYQAPNWDMLQPINVSTAQLQNNLWAAVKAVDLPQQQAIAALIVSGMNDVLNSQGYTQAAWLNRIPPAAWALLGLLAICANLMMGLSLRLGRKMRTAVTIIPVVLAVALLLIADIDSPRGGMIRVKPVNLISLAVSLGS